MSRLNPVIGTSTIIVLMISGCSDLAGPGMQTAGIGFTTGSTVVSQDLAQLSVAGVTSETTTGVFSIGWKKFVGPDIAQSGTIGEAYAVVQSDTGGQQSVLEVSTSGLLRWPMTEGARS